MNDATRKRRPQDGANFIDRTDRRYGMLTVIRRAEDRPMPYIRKNGKPRAPEVQWLCRCDCGNEKVILANALRSTSSCGCLRRQRKPRPGWQPKSTLPPGVAARNGVLKQYRTSARSRGLAWSLSDEEFDRITSEDCLYCGCPPSAVRRGANPSLGEFVYNGIDRVDNRRGYVTGNAVPCCSVCNHAKKDMSYDDFIAWITRLARFQGRLEALWHEIGTLNRQCADLKAREAALTGQAQVSAQPPDSLS